MDISLTLLAILIIVLPAYLFGSIPFGLILTRLAGLGDIRAIGSGNIGATNVLRTGSKKLALFTVLLDAAKGALPVLISLYFMRSGIVAIIMGLFAALGHMFPVWLKFKGGKGVATAFGVIMAFSWPVGLLSLATWMIIAFSTRLSSLAALFTVIMAPVYYGLLVFIKSQSCGQNCGFEILYAYYCLPFLMMISLLIIFKHRTNIKRLLNGTEPKISLKKQS